MKLEELEARRVSELMSLIVDTVPEAKAEDPISKTSAAISRSPHKMVVAVDKEQKVVGVISGGDMLKLFSGNRTISTKEQTASVMNPDVVQVDVSDRISDVVSKLTANPGIRDVVVSDKGKYVGIIGRQKLANEVRELLR